MHACICMYGAQPACCLSFNQKTPDQIVGGLYNGTICLWDLRKAGVYEQTEVATSHSETIYDIQWIQSKTATEIVSVSTDGIIKWWDVRKLSGTCGVVRLCPSCECARGSSACGVVEIFDFSVREWGALFAVPSV
jgi:WD40 repeat protein